jgi:hypothetical protein
MNIATLHSGYSGVPMITGRSICRAGIAILVARRAGGTLGPSDGSTDGDGDASWDADGATLGEAVGSTMLGAGEGVGGIPARVASVYVTRPAVMSATPAAVSAAGSRRVRTRRRIRCIGGHSLAGQRAGAA